MNYSDKQRLIKLAEEEIPIHKYWGLKVLSLEENMIRVKMPFKKEFVGDIRTNRWHGGIIAAVMDSLGGAIGVINFQSPEDKLSTIDLRVDYLRYAEAKDIIFEGELVRLGNRIMVTKMKAQQENTIVAEGKGVYNFFRKE